MLDVADALLNLLEPTDDVGRDDTFARPFNWTPNTLYLFPESDEHALAGAGNPPEERENFVVRVVFIADSEGEESKGRRNREVSELLNDKAHHYAALIAANRSRYATGQPAPWQHLQSFVDYDYLTGIEVRGVSLRVSGYRFI